MTEHTHVNTNILGDPAVGSNVRPCLAKLKLNTMKVERLMQPSCCTWQARAAAAAVAAADAAMAAGERFAVATLDIGLDAKAALEAFTAIKAKHAELPVIMFSPDSGAGDR